MKESTNPVSALSHQQRVELEMLHSVLADDANYPWNPYDPATQDYLDKLEASLSSDDLPEDAVASKWSQIRYEAEQLWENRSESLTTSLVQKFGARVPTRLLTQLAVQAQAASNSGRALMDQLVDCVQAVLADWEPDDLQVMARPLAMAMRDGQGEILDITLRSVRQTEWEELSEVEQARLSLAIARYALDELSKDERG